MIDVKNLSYRIGHKELISGVTSGFRRGEVTAILGPNGAGKSTLLKCMTGSVADFSGTITLDGKVLEAYSIDELARRRAVLSQAVQITFPFKVVEIVAMGRAPWKDAAGRIEEITHECLRLVDATDLTNRVFSSLSGGEQQRVQFARVLAQVCGQEGAYLFLDEPTSALDFKHQIEVLNIARSLAERKNFGVVAVLHDLRLAQKYADNILLLKDGQVVGPCLLPTDIHPEDIAQVFDLRDEEARFYLL